jgi:hypothetical protein
VLAVLGAEPRDDLDLPALVIRESNFFSLT